MKIPGQSNPSVEDLRNLAKGFDEYVSYIDNGAQYREALEKNELIKQILNHFGYNLDMVEITPIKQTYYEVDGRTFQNLDDARGWYVDTIYRIKQSPHIVDKEDSIQKFSRVQEVQIYPDFSDGYWRLIKHKMIIKDTNA